MNIIVSGMIKDKRRTRTLPDPDPESIKYSSIRIRYNKKSRGYLRQLKKEWMNK